MAASMKPPVISERCIQVTCPPSFSAPAQIRPTRPSGSFVKGLTRTDKEWDIAAFYNPLRNLSLSARLEFVDRSGASRTFQNYSVNWSPFQDGDLQLFFNYSETLRSESDARETFIGPGLKWTIGRHIFLDMNYNFTVNDTNTQKTESNIFNSELRLVF